MKAFVLASVVITTVSASALPVKPGSTIIDPPRVTKTERSNAVVMSDRGPLLPISDRSEPEAAADTDIVNVDRSDLDFASYIAWLRANPEMTDEERDAALPNLRAGTPGENGDYDPLEAAAEQGIDIDAIENRANSPLAELYTPVVGCSVRININLTTQSLTLSQNGGPARGWAISSGKQGRSTPTGCYGVTQTIKNAYSNRYNAKMPNAVFFIGTLYGLHAGALPRNPARGYGLSHGCVRQSYANSLTTYNAAVACRAGTRICISR